MRAGPTLTGSRVILRMGRRRDVSSILEYFVRNRKHLAPWDPRRPRHFLTEPYWRQRLRLNQLEFRQDHSLRMFLFRKEEPDRVIGTVNFSNLVRGPFQACTLGYSLDAREQGKGYMTEALRLTLSYAFGALKLHRVMANYVPRNRRSKKLLARLGFRVEGYARDYLRIAGRWQDHVLTSLVSSSPI